MSDSLQDRGKALENLFYANQDQELLAKLRGELVTEKKMEALSAASGVTDPNTLDMLVSHEVSPETMTAVALIPLVAVAWADGKMDDGERTAILKAANEADVSEGSASYGLLESWLQSDQPEGLLESWKTHISSLKGLLEAAALGQLKNSVVKRATEVAKSAGGFLGLSTISEVEQKILAEIEEAFA